MQLKKDLEELIRRAVGFGLPDADVHNARMMLDHNEFGLALNTITTQI